MQPRLEERDPIRDLGGLCECFVYARVGTNHVAELHIHQHFELLYCLKGRFELTVDQRRYPLGPGDVALIHPMGAHSTEALEVGENSYLVLKFMPESLYFTGLHVQKYLFPYLHFSEQNAHIYRADDELAQRLNSILQEREKMAYGHEMALHADISRVMLWFLRAWQRGRDIGLMDERTLIRLQKAQGYIDQHMDDALRAEDVAAYLDMGLSTFSRFFSEASGMSFPAYVRGRRLGKAVLALTQTSKSITEIAMETGFSSASYMVLCFRQQYGVTPTQFRKLSGGQEKELFAGLPNDESDVLGG